MTQKQNNASTIISRFAPSPTGWLHLGHAYSALCAAQHSDELYLRIEDIDAGRVRREFYDAIIEDLNWLGINYRPQVLKQSERMQHYAAALKTLRTRGLVYPCAATRSEISAAIAAREAETGERVPRDPEGAPLYPHLYRDINASARQKLFWEDKPFAWRLDIERALKLIDAPLTYREIDFATNTIETLPCNPHLYGDVILARKEIATSYHLSVVVDDAAQGITHVIRGKDLQSATAVHRLLQNLLGLPEPIYHHHKLIKDENGRKLSKQNNDKSLRAYKKEGYTAQEVMELLKQ